WIIGNRGGGIDSSGGHIVRNLIANNQASSPGGGIWTQEARSIIGNLVRNNRASKGGGIHGWADVFEENRIIGNEANIGGGLYASDRVTRCLILGNAARRGAALAGGEGATFVSSMACANRGSEVVALLYSSPQSSDAELSILATTLAGNEGILTDWYPDVGISFPRSPRVEFEGSIAWDLGGFGTAQAILSTSDVRGASPSAETGVIDADPLFVDAAHWDYRLRLASPCLDGSDLDLPDVPSRDADGDPRVAPGRAQGGFRADMGGDELRFARGAAAASVPAVFRLPDAAPGAEARASLEIANLGEAPLRIASLGIDGPEADAFSIASPAEPIPLSPLEVARIEVAFRPAYAGPHQAWLHVSSDDPLRPEQDVVILGLACAPPADLICISTGQGRVALHWDPAPSRATLLVLRDGAFIAELPSEARDFEDGGSPSGRRSYEVIATWGADHCSLGTCEIHEHGAFVRGDATGEGKTDLSDAVRILGVLFSSEPTDCLDAADVDDDGILTLGDAIRLLEYLFVSGSAPRPPFPEAGFDPTDDGLGCDRG
ncbi:MAG: hypothetical protein JXP34_23470, partial [Planctomycetes bacterium]|nr:hypothetical protein [Planctomycetota bacterium]